MKLIIDIPDTAYEAIQAVKNIDGSNEGTLENVLIKAVENGKPIPDDAEVRITIPIKRKAVQNEKNSPKISDVNINQKCRL